MTDHFIEIYENHGDQYQRLIAAEDVDGNLPRALRAITPFKGQRVLDLGSGTGRIPHLLAGDDPRHLVALDLHRDMLAEQARQMAAHPQTWHLLQGDARRLPIASGWADVVIAGWAFGHFCAWFADDWQHQIEIALAAMVRAAAPGSHLIILETLGTGADLPAPPTPALADYYALLENQYNFRPQTISTDYQFNDLAQATELIGFFFGETLAAQITANNSPDVPTRVPEWTGLWHKQLP